MYKVYINKRQTELHYSKYFEHSYLNLSNIKKHSQVLLQHADSVIQPQTSNFNSHNSLEHVKARIQGFFFLELEFLGFFILSNLSRLELLKDSCESRGKKNG